MQVHAKAGREAVRLLFVFLMTLAIKSTLELCFAPTSGQKVPGTSGERIALFFIFFSFISRFLLGGYRVLSEDIAIEVRRQRIWIDSLFLGLMAMVFYVYSIAALDAGHTEGSILVICGLDLVWLLCLQWSAQDGCLSGTQRQWLAHDALFILFLMLVAYADDLMQAIGIPIAFLLGLVYANHIIRAKWGNWRSVAISAISVGVFAAPLVWLAFPESPSLLLAWFVYASLAAFLMDIGLNHRFYFGEEGPQLKIFVAGPYGDGGPHELIEENVRRAEEVGKAIALKGHFPFIPHTMLHGWEGDSRFTPDVFKKIDFGWLDKCDALFFIAPSDGTNGERAFAQWKGLRIFSSMDQVPDATSSPKDSA